MLFDLPLNPDLLEQRIGRLDRIGQMNAVEIHVPVFKHTASSVLLDWLHRGIDALEQICPAGPALLAEFAEPLAECMAAPEDEALLEALIERTRARAEALLEALQQGRDRLLELNSFDRDRAQAVVADVDAAAHTQQLRVYMDQVFDEFGVEHDDNGPTSEVLQPGDHMSHETFPGLPDGGLTVTFERIQAQTRDDMHFLTWEHPMVSGAMDMVLGSEFGNTSFGVVKNAAFEPGTFLIECLFVVVCPAPKELRVERFLSQSTLRFVIDSHGVDMTSRCSVEWMNQSVRDVPAAAAQKVIPRLRDQVERLTDRASELCEIQHRRNVADAQSRVESEVVAEIERLRQLSRVNPNIRAEEVTAFEEDRDRYRHFLSIAQLKLDAVRVAVAT